METKGKLLDSATISNGAKRVFNAHPCGFYVVAEMSGESDTTTVVGCLRLPTPGAMACFGGYNGFVLTGAHDGMAHTIP